MNEYLTIALVSTVGCVFVAGAVQLRTGNGLLTKLFRMMGLSLVLIANIGYALGRQGISVGLLAIVTPVVVGLVTLMIIVIQKTIVERVQTQTAAVSRVVHNMAATSNQAAASAVEQASSVTQVSTAVEEIHQMSEATAATSQEVLVVAGQAFAQGQQGLDAVREASRIMDSIAQTADFVEIVNQVAEQSNLLAFNAGIEAAKAEEYGRGFSVVASEVRNLAEQSKQAAKQIRNSIRQTETGQKAIRTTDSIISELANVLQDASDKARQISGAALQQSAGIKQISDAIGNLRQSGTHTATTARQVKEYADELSQVTNRLTAIIYGKSEQNTGLSS